ncbi:hypothetical protein [Paenibacillus xerothermodurans]|uniref:Methyl-accepting chemotaxis protein n=1 Tax=Paenibacillus xerothermodurans TaxID=1977292 RepID=A0A2W1P330_PAEXE|nr:hypothetical protein [Paenibacillus xerothermodurans]PZE21558.1 hypothetical protein CBW46_003660 [Paenibacillus xerothermodurans]
MQQVNASAQRMGQLMAGVASVAEQSAANTQNVAAAAKEQNASMQEVSALADDLSKTGEDLQPALNNFKV